MIPYPEDHWDPPRVDIHFLCGPDRIYDDNPTDDPPRRPVGFVAPPPPEREPLTWEGDNT